MIDPIAAMYLVLAVLSLGCAVWGKDWLLIFLACVMLASWSVSNMAVAALGFSRAPLLIPETDAALGVIVWFMARPSHRLAPALVFALFVVEQMVHVTFLHIHAATSLQYIVALNLVFAAQCLVVGVAGVRQRYVDRHARRTGGVAAAGGPRRRAF